MNYVGIDWAYGRAAYCALNREGSINEEGLIPADEDGLAKLVLSLGTEVEACVEMMSGAVWVRDRLEAAGWHVEVADARKVKGLAPLACKTDRVDARALAGRELPAEMRNARALLVNEREALLLTGASDVETAAAQLATQTPLAIVTLGESGALAAGAEGTVRVEGVAVEAVDTTGAGDLFAAALPPAE